MSAPHPFSLRQLQYLVAISETLSFRKAAERCNVSQPSLSAQLAELESGLGVRVFERDRRRVLLTPSGRDLVERARRILEDADNLREAARLAGDPFSGSLKLGVIPTISPYLLPAVMPEIRKQYPRLRILWIEEKTSSLLSSLHQGLLDAVLLALETNIGKLERFVIATDPFVLATPKNHPLGMKKAAASPSELINTG